MKNIGIRGLLLLILALTLNYSVDVSAELWTPELGRDPSPGDIYVNPKDSSVMVWIPGGEFFMGTDVLGKDAKPRHKVAVDGFWLGKYEVTVSQYLSYIRDTNDSPTPYLYDDPAKKGNFPVFGLTYREALKYMYWAGLRLPTEAEWEYAAAAGKQLPYPTADGTISHELVNFEGAEGKDVWDDAPSPVGSFPPNPFGLHDMAGNVMEWTSSSYLPYPYVKGDGREDKNYEIHNVLRGGAWHFPSNFCATTYRHRFLSYLRYDYAGMRVAKTYTKMVK
jgi:formylglycine-generating enzyme required for sulfatase activity